MQISILPHEKHCQNKKLSATKRRWNVGPCLHYYQTRQLNFTSLGLPRYLIDRLQRIQNSAARLITGSRKYEHITPILKQLHWLPIDERIKYKILLLTFKALNDLAPIYIGDMLCKYAPSRRFSASSNKHYKYPRQSWKPMVNGLSFLLRQNYGTRYQTWFDIALLWKALRLKLRPFWTAILLNTYIFTLDFKFNT